MSIFRGLAGDLAGGSLIIARRYSQQKIEASSPFLTLAGSSVSVGEQDREQFLRSAGKLA